MNIFKVTKISPSPTDKIQGREFRTAFIDEMAGFSGFDKYYNALNDSVILPVRDLSYMEKQKQEQMFLKFKNRYDNFDRSQNIKAFIWIALLTIMLILCAYFGLLD